MNEQALAYKFTEVLRVLIGKWTQLPNVSLIYIFLKIVVFNFNYDRYHVPVWWWSSFPAYFGVKSDVRRYRVEVIR